MWCHARPDESVWVSAHSRLPSLSIAFPTWSPEILRWQCLLWSQGRLYTMKLYEVTKLSLELCEVFVIFEVLHVLCELFHLVLVCVWAQSFQCPKLASAFPNSATKARCKDDFKFPPTVSVMIARHMNPSRTAGNYSSSWCFNDAACNKSVLPPLNCGVLSSKASCTSGIGVWGIHGIHKRYYVRQMRVILGCV